MKALDLVEAKLSIIEAYEADDFERLNNVVWTDYNDNILFTSIIRATEFEMLLPNGQVILVEPICKMKL